MKPDHETGSTMSFNQWPALALATFELRDRRLHILYYERRTSLRGLLRCELWQN